MDNSEAEKSFILDNLRKIDFLAHHPKDKLEEIAKKIVKINFDKGDYVLKEGRSGGAFFVLASGRLSVLAENSKGEEVKVGQLEPIAYFGEIALLSKSERYASVMADENVVVYMLGKDVFNSLLLTIPEAKETIEKVAEERRIETHRIIYSESSEEHPKEKKGSFFSRLIGKS